MKSFWWIFAFVSVIVLAFSSCVHSAASGSSNPITPAAESKDYVVFAWNDLGMHCLNPTYDTLVILPPYNTVDVQVVKRGNPPELMSGAAVTVEYSIVDNTYSYGKGAYGQFWDKYTDLFPAPAPAHNIGMTGKGLSGPMDWVPLNVDGGDGVYRAQGIPVVPRTNSAPTVRAPYQQALILVKSSSGTELARTMTTVPTSDEINCAKCHSPGGTVTETFQDILAAHDSAESTSLSNSTPVLCASCHGSPALGAAKQSEIPYLSAAIHGYHATKGASCLDCHPGETTKCNRSIAHSTSTGGTCENCHGTMAQVAGSITSSGRVPWATEPKCADCHTSSTGTTPMTATAGSASAIAQADTGNALYRNAKGHGGVACTACHGSPHSMVPSREAKDNYQAIAYQGKATTIGSCAACHRNSHGEGSGEFMEIHGGASPETDSACGVCHTGFGSSASTTTSWPHRFQWKARS